MSRNVNDVIRTLNSAQRKRVEARAAELIAEEMTLQELRRARKLTQVAWQRPLGSLRTVFRALRSAAISCFPPCGRPSR